MSAGPDMPPPPEYDDDLGRWADDDAGGPPTGLVVQELRIVMTDPPRYEVLIDGAVVTCSLAELLNRAQFQARCLAVLHRIPWVPSGKGAIQAWQATVNQWLADAIRIEAPPEASPKTYERAGVAEGLASLIVVSADEEGAASDFRRGCAVYRKGRAFVRLASLMARFRAEHPKMGPDDLADHLRILGWVACKVRLSGEEAQRAWYAERTVWGSNQSWCTQVAEIEAEGRQDA